MFSAPSLSISISGSPVTSYLLKIVLGELVRNAEQLAAGVRVCEGPDAQTVGGIQLSLEELTAGLLDLSQLEEAGGREQRLDVSLLHGHLGATEVGTFSHIATKLRLVRQSCVVCRVSGWNPAALSPSRSLQASAGCSVMLGCTAALHCLNFL